MIISQSKICVWQRSGFLNAYGSPASYWPWRAERAWLYHRDGRPAPRCTATLLSRWTDSNYAHKVTIVKAGVDSERFRALTRTQRWIDMCRRFKFCNCSWILRRTWPVRDACCVMHILTQSLQFQNSTRQRSSQQAYVCWSTGSISGRRHTAHRQWMDLDLFVTCMQVQGRWDNLSKFVRILKLAGNPRTPPHLMFMVASCQQYWGPWWFRSESRLIFSLRCKPYLLWPKSWSWGLCLFVHNWQIFGGVCCSITECTLCGQGDWVSEEQSYRECNVCTDVDMHVWASDDWSFGEHKSSVCNHCSQDQATCKLRALIEIIYYIFLPEQNYWRLAKKYLVQRTWDEAFLSCNVSLASFEYASQSSYGHFCWSQVEAN